MGSTHVIFLGSAETGIQFTTSPATLPFFNTKSSNFVRFRNFTPASHALAISFDTGGGWLGGYMMNPVTVRDPAQKIWEEMGIPFKKVGDGLYLTPGPHAVSKLIASACDAGVKFLNLTKFDDLVLKNGRVAGLVVNWMPVSALPRNITCVDPIALESKMVIDASGHDSVAVKRLVDRGLVTWKGMNPMHVEEGEDQVVHKTGEIYPGLVIAGMSVTETHGLARMGPTFGSMLFSGMKAAEITAAKIDALGV